MSNLFLKASAAQFGVFGSTLLLYPQMWWGSSPLAYWKGTVPKNTDGEFFIKGLGITFLGLAYGSLFGNINKELMTSYVGMTAAFTALMGKVITSYPDAVTHMWQAQIGVNTMLTALGVMAWKEM